MFGKLMNSYFYGKSGKGDYTPEDMPTTRGQLFRETLRTRLAGLLRLNLVYMLAWLPAMVIIAYHVLASGEVRLNEELAECRLIAPEKLRPWDFGTGLALRDWLRGRGIAA